MEYIPGNTFLPANPGEESALRFLLPRLEHDAGYLLTNVYVPDNDNRLCEMDIVVINENGVYDIEVKNWVGSLVAGADSWSGSGGARPNPALQAERQARVLHGYLKSERLGQVSTCGLALLVNGLDRVSYPDRYPYKRLEFGADDRLIAAIQGRAYVHRYHSPRLAPEQMARIARLIAPHPDQPRPLQIAGFQVTRRGHTKPDAYYTELEGYDVELPSRRVRIKAYRLGQAITVGQIARAVERFKRELMALHEAGEHENLVKPIQFTRDMRSDDGYFLILEHTGLQTLAQALQAGPLPAARRRVILRDTAAALAFCHRKKFVHRSLSSNSIYLTPQGRAKVGDFELARLPGLGETITTGRALGQLAARQNAPEQRRDIHDVDERADVFALGALWYELLLAPPAEQPLNLERIDSTPLDEAAKALLRRLLADDRDQRPPTMVAVLDELDALSGV